MKINGDAILDWIEGDDDQTFSKLVSRMMLVMTVIVSIGMVLIFALQVLWGYVGWPIAILAAIYPIYRWVRWTIRD